MTATAGARDLVRDVLDELPVTDTVFHDLSYNRPLAALLLDAIDQRPRTDRILLVGPNVALAQALTEQGRRVHVWHVPGVAITESLRGAVERVGDLDTLFGSPVDGAADPYDVVVLPFVLDSASAEPAALLEVVRALTSPNGVVLAALRRAGGLDARVRAMRGRSLFSASESSRHSWSWPSAAPRRLLDTDALRAAARRAGFRLAVAEHVVDAYATAGVDALPLSVWMRLQAAHAAKRVVPALRDTLLATLTPFGMGRDESGYGPDLPAVTVVVTTDDSDRALRIKGHLEEQTYPRELIEVLCARPGADSANEAVRRATGEVVAFTDDWSRLPAGWIDSGVRAMGEYTAALAGGVLAEQGSAVPFFGMPDRKLKAGGKGLYLAANSFYVRDALLAVGGFDESVGAAWGWDSSAAPRLRSAGFPIAEDETAFVFRMYPFPPDRSWIREEFRRATQVPFAVRRDPDLRRTALNRRFFASERTRSFDVALVALGLAVARRKPSYAVVGALPWAKTVIEYVDVWPPAEWRTTFNNLRGIGLRNAIWLAGLTLGSIQARRVVL